MIHCLGSFGNCLIVKIINRFSIACKSHCGKLKSIPYFIFVCQKYCLPFYNLFFHFIVHEKMLWHYICQASENKQYMSKLMRHPMVGIQHAIDMELHHHFRTQMWSPSHPVSLSGGGGKWGMGCLWEIWSPSCLREVFSWEGRCGHKAERISLLPTFDQKYVQCNTGRERLIRTRFIRSST